MSSGSLSAVSEGPRDPPQSRRHANQRDGGRHDKRNEKKAEAGEQRAECQDRAQVRDETGGKDQLAEVVTIEARLDHHGIDHSNGGRAQRHPADLRGAQVPAENEIANRHGGEKREGEGGDTD